MRLIFIRHGDPDYEKDSVTEKGEPVSGLRVQMIGDGDFVENGYTNVRGQVTLPMSNSDITDDNGNVNDAWTATLKYEYNYQISDIEGVYQAIGYDQEGVGYYLSAGKDAFVSIVSDDTQENCNVSIAGLFDAGSKIYGYFDVKKGTLSIPDYQLLAKDFVIPQVGSYDVYFANAVDESPVVMNVPESGHITCEMPFMFYVPDAGASFGTYVLAEFIRNAAETSSYTAKTLNFTLSSCER